MSNRGFPFYKEQLEMILAVTNMLNEHSDKIPTSDNYYFKVQLVEAYEGKVIGEWSDEVGPKDWDFSLTETKPKNDPRDTVVSSRLTFGPGIEISSEGIKGL